MDLHGLQGHSLPHHGFHHGLQGNLCSGARSTSSFFTDRGVYRVVSLTLSQFSPPAAVAQPFFLLFKYIIPGVLPPSLMSSALASGGSVVESAGIGSVGRGGSFWQLLTEATPIAPLLPKPCHANPIREVILLVRNC